MNISGPSKYNLLKAYQDGEQFVQSCGFCLESKGDGSLMGAAGYLTEQVAN